MEHSLISSICNISVMRSMEVVKGDLMFAVEGTRCDYCISMLGGIQ
jgi:hypothetical protein